MVRSGVRVWWVSSCFAVLSMSCAELAPVQTAYSYRMGGEDRLVLYEYVDEYVQDIPAGGVDAHRMMTLTDEAANEFGCSPNEVDAHPLKESPTGVFVARGCGHAAAYLLVARTETRTHAKGHEGIRLAVTTERFIDLGHDDLLRELGVIQLTDSAGVEPPVVYSSPGWSGRGPDGVYDASLSGLARYVNDWALLLQQGSRDLDCPRDKLLPYFKFAGARAADWPIVEGCGKRATYLPGREPPYQISAVASVK